MSVRLIVLGGILRNEGHGTRIGISLIAHGVVERATVRIRNTDVVSGDGEGREEQDLFTLTFGPELPSEDTITSTVLSSVRF